MAIAGTMSSFRINELSGVRIPAQKGARAVFMKADADAEPIGAVDWSATRKQALQDLEDSAKRVQASNPGMSYAKAYAAVLATPDGDRGFGYTR